MHRTHKRRKKTISNCPLRCHEYDRSDELKMITFNRQLNGGPAKKREKLEAKIRLAQAELEAFDVREIKTDRWIKLLEDSLVHHWIDNPDQYIKDWEANNPVDTACK